MILKQYCALVASLRIAAIDYSKHRSATQGFSALVADKEKQLDTNVASSTTTTDWGQQPQSEALLNLSRSYRERARELQVREGDRIPK